MSMAMLLSKQMQASFYTPLMKLTCFLLTVAQRVQEESLSGESKDPLESRDGQCHKIRILMYTIAVAELRTGVKWDTTIQIQLVNRYIFVAGPCLLFENWLRSLHY